MSASGSSALGDVDSFLKSLRFLVCGVPCHQLSLLGFLSGSFFSEERAVAVDRRLVLIGPSVLLLVRRLLRRMRCVHPVPLLSTGFGLKECTRSQFLFVGGDIIHLLSRTTALVVANSSSFRRLGAISSKFEGTFLSVSCGNW
ncbi:hypothetical protein F2Q70_00005012 [Brassica cretica]|uniref:Uncharacterized protein n=1 Tax=Brassica cretica TaxID=69181 RepID=A0A8S9ILV7_BRACR|nr:hypothetical protein F2Q70_00005012 [Brassica cretica]